MLNEEQADVRSGSKAHITLGPMNASLYLRKRHSRLRFECPLCANSGHGVRLVVRYIAGKS
jgi:hypothetical protein